MERKSRKQKRLIRKKRIREAVSRRPEVAPENQRRLRWGFFAVILMFGILTFRVAYWQIVRSDDLNEKATEMQDQDITINPVRGTIYDSNMNPLAQSITEYEIYAYTQTLYKDKQVTKTQRKQIVTNIAKYTGLKEKDVESKLSGEENLVKIASGMKREDAKKLQKLYGDNIMIKTSVARNYPNGDFASHVIGFVDSNNSGRSGLEYEYNSLLTGVKGREVSTTDSQGNALSNGSRKYYKAEDGYSIVTTIDEVIQNYVEEAVAKGEKKTRAESISCVVMNPKTGDVLAMVNYPSYNPNDPYEPSDPYALKKFSKMSEKKQSEYLSQMWTNSIVSGVYEPGSTFKLITAASALDSGSADSKSRYKDPGYIVVNGTKINCWGTAHGTQSLKQAVGNSCNPAMARVALNMGADTFYSYIDLFGFKDKTGIDLPGEGNSIVKDPSNLGKVDLATTGFGQGIAITPIQLMCAVNALGNDGYLMKPKVVRKVLDSDGNTVKTYSNTKVRKVISTEVADKMREIMQYYVEKGGGGTVYIPGYRIGGKTGTANIASNGGYSKDTVASFITMAPMDDPKVTVLVMVKRPKGSEFGSVNAGPIAKEILSNVLPYLGVEKKYAKNESHTTETTVTVPKVTGMNSQSAIHYLSAKGLKYKVMPAGSGKTFHVVDQYPKAGSAVKPHSTVYLYSE
ncbi:MAG: penicillin-binding transpeptidase domain-containing protein [Eubacteriales bacterium]|nr:penicillin-binding transpeptidase domain-containing protein [Eubacteriales bacterium]